MNVPALGRDAITRDLWWEMDLLFFQLGSYVVKFYLTASSEWGWYFFLIYQTWFNPVSHWSKYYQPSAFIIPMRESESLLAESPEYPEWASSGRNWKYSVRKTYGMEQHNKRAVFFYCQYLSLLFESSEVEPEATCCSHLQIFTCTSSPVPIPEFLCLCSELYLKPENN